MPDQRSPEPSINSIRRSVYEVPIHDDIRERSHRGVGIHNNFVLDCRIAPDSLTTCKFRDDREFAVMRYTAATCDPGAFMEQGYTLRPRLFDPPRHTEIFLVLSLHDEDQELFCRTLHGVMKNIAHLCTRDRSDVWGQAGWKKVVVCVVSDGLATVHPRALSVIEALGVYRETGPYGSVINAKTVTAYIYEYTSHISVTPDMEVQHAEHGITPVQMIFCYPAENIDINPNRWPFHAFAPVLQPNVCVQLDVGTTPAPQTIYHIWKTFDLESYADGRSPSWPQVDAHLRLVEMKVERKIRKEIQYRGQRPPYHRRFSWMTSLRLKIIKVVLFPTRIRFKRT